MIYNIFCIDSIEEINQLDITQLIQILFNETFELTIHNYISVLPLVGFANYYCIKS